MADAWAIVEDIWTGTVVRARELPEPVLHEHVEGEWSFVQTHRHLVLATDCWLRRMVRGIAHPYHPWAMRPDLDDLDQEIAQVRRGKKAAIDRRDFETSAALRDQEKQLLATRAAREKEWARAAAGRPPVAKEFGQVNAELVRLPAILREHGIALDDDTASAEVFGHTRVTTTERYAHVR